MHTHADKSREKRSRSVASGVRNTDAPAPDGPPVIQRYFAVNSGAAGYTPAVGTIFESQRKEDNAAKRTEKLIQAGNNTQSQEERFNGAAFVAQGAPVVAGGVPNINVSANSELAIENTTSEPRNYFSTPAALAATNNGLQNADSQVRLTATGQTIDVPTNPDPAHYNAVPKTLSKIRVDPAIEPGGNLGVFFGTNECNNFIKRIVSNAERVVVIGSGANEREVAADSENEPFRAVADYVTATPPAAQTPAGLETAMTLNAPAPNAEAAYNMPAAKGNVSAALGINTAASPEIGEGFVIKPLKSDIDQELAAQYANPGTPFTRPGGGDVNDQYLQALNALRATNLALDVKLQGLSIRAESLKHLWIYHYAGVVARDGGDVITLENYNRGQEKKWNISDAFNDLFVAHQAFRNFVWGQVNELKARDFDTQRTLINQAQARGNAVNGALQVVLDQAHTAANEHIGPTMDMFHFKMYGDQPGQSFHEKWQPSTANQITLRIRQSLQQTRAAKLALAATARNSWLAALNQNCPNPTVAARLLVYRAAADVRIQAFRQNIANAANLHDIKLATDGINQEKVHALAELQTCLTLLRPGIAPQASLPLLIAQIQGEINNNPIGRRILYRQQARDLKNSLQALHAAATAVHGILIV